MSCARTKAPWYDGGLSFSCLGCGDCCRGPGGYVWLSEDEAKAIARALEQEFAAFASRTLRNTLVGLALIDDARGNCPLLDSNGRCRVYPVRPRQCRTWPWWKENLASRRRWEDLASRCPGMNRGVVHSISAIEKAMAGKPSGAVPIPDS
ncbi:MAG: YkgJ family cysteine cluster protein [Planctomycetota bacterium]|nr:YkgJ family cysteine cluster protein [Planctomycetota bacterium]